MKFSAYLFSGAFAGMAGLTLACQDTGRMAKANAQMLAVALILLSIFWNQREGYLAEKKIDPKKKFPEMLPKLHTGIWFSGIVMMAVYAAARNGMR